MPIRIIRRSTSSLAARAVRAVGLLLLAGGVGAGCSDARPAAADWPVDPAHVTGGERTRGDSVRLAIYLDATVSMTGYVADGTSNYTAFLEELESSVATGWRDADVRFFKFGNQVREIARPEFLSARTAAFYNEPGMREVTAIHSVIGCEDDSTDVQVLITDLFQQDRDVNALVSAIKERCFERGRAVAVLAIPSEFDGTVYDARVPAYRYASVAGDSTTYRPFYALAFGDEGDIDRLVRSLARQPFVRTSHYVLIADHVVDRYAVELTKTRESRGINARAPSGPYAFNVDVRKGESGGTLVADVALTLDPAAPPLRAGDVELVAWRRGSGEADSARTDDVTLREVTRTDDGLRAVLALEVGDPPGHYSYHLTLRTGALDGFDAPAWVQELSSANPTAAADANKTLNLAKFVSDLRRARSSVRQPALAQWALTVRKL